MQRHRIARLNSAIDNRLQTTDQSLTISQEQPLPDMLVHTSSITSLAAPVKVVNQGPTLPGSEPDFVPPTELRYLSFFSSVLLGVFLYCTAAE